MNANVQQNLEDLYSSNAFGDISEWRNLDDAALRAECADLRAHWLSQGWEVHLIDADDMVEFLRQQWLSTYLIGDEHGADTTVEAGSLEQALELAKDWARDGSWDTRCEIDVFAVELDPTQDDGRDRRGAEVGNRVWATVEVGEDPPEPECTEDAHDWQAPHSIVGGLRENPGVWSQGGTTMTHHSVCAHCGLHRHETRHGAQRNPGQLDTVEYRRGE